MPMGIGTLIAERLSHTTVHGWPYTAVRRVRSDTSGNIGVAILSVVALFSFKEKCLGSKLRCRLTMCWTLTKVIDLKSRLILIGSKNEY